jgi:putative exporter of polyketide antibiotics
MTGPSGPGRWFGLLRATGPRRLIPIRRDGSRLGMATVGLYDTRARHGATINNTPRWSPLASSTTSPLWALSMIKLGAFGGAMVAVLAIIPVIRHTRAEEEAGRLNWSVPVMGRPRSRRLWL